MTPREKEGISPREAKTDSLFCKTELVQLSIVVSIGAVILTPFSSPFWSSPYFSTPGEP